MITRGDISATPVGRVTSIAGVEAVADARQEAFARTLSTLVGKTLQATVISRLGDGTFLVEVAGARARMALPANPQAGTEVPLTLVSLSPRPTFQTQGANATTLLTAQAMPNPGEPAAGAARAAPGSTAALPAAATPNPLPLPASGAPGAGGAVLEVAPRTSPGAAAALAQAVNVTPKNLPAGAAILPAGPDPAAPVLSHAARVIGSVIGTALKSDNAPTAIVARTPLLGAPVLEPAKLAAAMKDAIGASGLFYESHVAEWWAGQRPLATLMREPQMQAAHPEARQPNAGATALEPVPLRALRFDLGAGGSGPTPAATDSATAQFINLQLTSQEQGRVAWQGQLWPGQDLAWNISRDDPENHPERGEGQADGQPAEPSWRSGLRLRFPLLGEIGATLVIVGDQLHIQVQAGSSAVGTLLRDRAGALSGALEAAGTPLASLTVSDTGARDE